MTFEGQNKSTKFNDITQYLSYNRLIFCFMSVFSFALILRNSDLAIEYMSRGLHLLATTVIPSLFPFMVISELIVASGVGDMLGKLLRKPMHALFGVSGAGSCAVLLGALCGFPVGARTAVSMLDSGEIDRSEAERLMTFCNNPSSAFTVSAVGVALYHSREFGVALYVITLLSSFTVALLGKMFFGNCDSATSKSSGNGRNISISAFTGAVTNATGGMLTVCAYVLFFSTLIGSLSCLLNSFEHSQSLGAVIYAIFEISGGVSEASAINNTLVSALVCAFAVNWSGISVHFQIISLCDGKGLSFRPYFYAKLLQSGISLILTYVYITFVNPHVFDTAKSVGAISGNRYILTSLGGGITIQSAILTSVFALCMILSFFLKRKRRQN